ncbi:MAG: hypothetical protein IPM55_18005 [Acidobacteria bacterium]|nr:hypothetical protein [Acidobacteriota bacterium]
MILFATKPVFAQESRGSVTGKVRDSNQSIISGASVMLHQRSHGFDGFDDHE